jgi:hypothetical protein
MYIIMIYYDCNTYQPGDPGASKILDDAVAHCSPIIRSGLSILGESTSSGHYLLELSRPLTGRTLCQTLPNLN